MPTASLSPEPGLRSRLPSSPFPAAARDTAPPLLPEFREGDACFASPTTTLHARGRQAALPLGAVAPRAVVLDECGSPLRRIPAWRRRRGGWRLRDQ